LFDLEFSAQLFEKFGRLEKSPKLWQPVVFSALAKQGILFKKISSKLE